RDAILVEANFFAVEEDIARLAHALKFEEHALAAAGGGGWQLKMLAIPSGTFPRAAVAAAVRDQAAIGVDIVIGVRGGDRFPRGIIEGGVLGVVGLAGIFFEEF